MPQDWHIALDNQEQRRKVAIVEGRARRDQPAAADDEVEFSLTFYSDQVSLYQFALIEVRFVNAFVGAQFIAPRRA